MRKDAQLAPLPCGQVQRCFLRPLAPWACGRDSETLAEPTTGFRMSLFTALRNHNRWIPFWPSVKAVSSYSIPVPHRGLFGQLLAEGQKGPVRLSLPVSLLLGSGLPPGHLAQRRCRSPSPSAVIPALHSHQLFLSMFMCRFFLLQYFTHLVCPLERAPPCSLPPGARTTVL